MNTSTTPTIKRVQTPAQAPLAVRISGRLLCDAVVRYTAGATPHALLIAELDGAGGLPIVAQQDLGTSATAHMSAHSKCARMRQHARVTVFGQGLSLVTRGDCRTLHLVQCTDVIPDTFITKASHD